MPHWSVVTVLIIVDIALLALLCSVTAHEFREMWRSDRDAQNDR